LLSLMLLDRRGREYAKARSPLPPTRDSHKLSGQSSSFRADGQRDVLIMSSENFSLTVRDVLGGSKGVRQSAIVVWQQRLENVGQHSGQWHKSPQWGRLALF
jgi:hypothetical protein